MMLIQGEEGDKWDRPKSRATIPRKGPLDLKTKAELPQSNHAQISKKRHACFAHYNIIMMAVLN
jgi:hypothetical protein